MSEIRALIVDDSSVMRKIVERALRQAGLELKEVHVAGSGVEGIEVLRVKRRRPLAEGILGIRLSVIVPRMAAKFPDIEPVFLR